MMMMMAVFKCVLGLIILVSAGAEDIKTSVNAADAAHLLQSEGLRLGELSKQVAETNRALEDLLTSKLRDIHYATVIGELRSEIDALRRDMHHMKESGPTARKSSDSSETTNEVTNAENTQKTMHWMQSTLVEVRNEMMDLSRSVNVSQQLQRQQQSDSQLQLVRSDVAALQSVSADDVAYRTQLNQTVQQVQDQLQRLDQRQQDNTQHLQRLENNMMDMRLEMQLSRKTEQQRVKSSKKPRQQRSLPDELMEVVAEEEAPLHHVRHEQHLKHEVYALGKMVKTLMAEQHDLQKQMVTLSQMRLTTESNVNKMEQELRSVLRRFKTNQWAKGCREDMVELTSQNKRLTAAVDKLNVKVGGVDQVQSSTLQLFEAMERLEERYDENISVLQREVSKLEFNDAQLTSSVHTLHEDQSNVNDMVKGIKATVTILQEQVHADQIRAALLTAKLANNTLQLTNQSLNQNQQKWHLQQLQETLSSTSPSVEQLRQSLTDVQKHYDHLVRDLPHDCRQVSSSGVNFILPRDSNQVLKVFCDQETSGGGWTLIQRRSDGKEDFNQNWAAYKSGFGSVNGEFWLGNDHLHELTKENTTMLRVDLWDIYGQYWWAEYDTFSVDDETHGYSVQFHGYQGNASDAMASYHQSMKFSTRDNDQDLSNTNCADSYQGGWWYSHCQHVNINGKYALGLTWYDSLENEWIALSKVEMKVRDKRIFSSDNPPGSPN